ncbi:MAG: DNA repair protein RecO [Candidatus Azobacteroides sp.]|nr:DNA repair protein RecO [Candidatus Azobacteroides sp.]
MLHKTAGVVLHSTKFSDKILLIHIYTEEFGMVTYGVAPGSSKKSGRKTAFFQPFTILELDVEHSNKREIHRIKDSKIQIPLTNIKLDPLKIPISLFLAEFIYRSVKETEPNKPLYNFIVQSIEVLELSEKGIANFHLVFLFKLTRFLGFYPNTEEGSSNEYFDLLNGIFVNTLPPHKHYLQHKDAQIFRVLMRMTYENMHIFSFSRKERMSIILKILEYYRLHLTEFSRPKSLDILQTLFD